MTWRNYWEMGGILMLTELQPATAVASRPDQAVTATQERRMRRYFARKLSSTC